MAWRFSFGPYGYTVTVFEAPDSKLVDGKRIIYTETRDRSRDKTDPSTGKVLPGYCTKSLGRITREEAEEYARQESAKLQLGVAESRANIPTLSRVLALYLEHRTPSKVSSEQAADKRRAKMWKRWLGANKDLRELSRREWDGFIKARRSGQIDAAGDPVATVEDRRPVRPGTVWADCVYLQSVLNFATEWRTEDGKFLMESNPARGFELPIEKNPRRAYATQDRFEAIIAVALQVHPFLAPLLTIINGTGRRIMAVLKLTFGDLVLVRTTQAPHGAISWPGETDKIGKAWSAPISQAVRAALDAIIAERPGVGAAFLFPSPLDPSRPISRYIADRWLIAAEKLAEVPKHSGSLWHAYRRKWATERKGLPDVDVAAAGGWSDPATLKIYQQVDDATLYRVVTEAVELREAKA